MTIEGNMDKGVLDDIIRRLLEGKGGKQVQLSEAEIRQLCVNARQIFLSEPNLLQLRAPIRICGLSRYFSSFSPILYDQILHEYGPGIQFRRGVFGGAFCFMQFVDDDRFVKVFAWHARRLIVDEFGGLAVLVII